MHSIECAVNQILNFIMEENLNYELYIKLRSKSFYKLIEVI